MLNACILLKVAPTRADVILKEILKLKGIKKAYYAYGRFDIVILLEAEDYKSLKKITGQINSIEGVRSTETLAEA